MPILAGEELRSNWILGLYAWDKEEITQREIDQDLSSQVLTLVEHLDDCSGFFL